MVAEYLGEFKNESLLKAKAEELGLDAKADMYKMHASFVGEYAEADARLTWRLHERFITEIEKEDLTKVYDIECRLIRVIFNMTKRGVRVDMEKAFDRCSWDFLIPALRRAGLGEDYVPCTPLLSSPQPPVRISATCHQQHLSDKTPTNYHGSPSSHRGVD